MRDNLFNHGLSIFRGGKARSISKTEKNHHSSYTSLTLKGLEKHEKKGIAFYEKALTLVDIQDSVQRSHIDTVTRCETLARRQGNSSISSGNGWSWLVQPKFWIADQSENAFSPVTNYKQRAIGLTCIIHLEGIFMWSKEDPFSLDLTFKYCSCNSFRLLLTFVQACWVTTLAGDILLVTSNAPPRRLGLPPHP